MSESPKVLLFRGRGALSRLIRWQTNGDYSHAALWLPGGVIIEAWGDGVRIREGLPDWRDVEAFDVAGMTDEGWSKAAKFAAMQVGKPYDYGAIARFLTRWRKDQDERWFCSELVFAAVRVGGVALLSRCDLVQVSPTVLSFSPLLVPAEVPMTPTPAEPEEKRKPKLGHPGR